MCGGGGGGKQPVPNSRLHIHMATRVWCVCGGGHSCLTESSLVSQSTHPTRLSKMNNYYLARTNHTWTNHTWTNHTQTNHTRTNHTWTNHTRPPP